MLSHLGCAILRALFGEGVEADAHRLVDVGPWSLFPNTFPFPLKDPQVWRGDLLRENFYASSLTKCLSK